MILLLVMVGAAVGAPCRWLLDRRVQSWHDSVFPWGTWLVNMLGCFALGLVSSAVNTGAAGGQAAALLGTGFCGGFTTYSTFGLETVQLAESGSRLAALTNILISVIFGTALAALGWTLGGLVWR